MGYFNNHNHTEYSNALLGFPDVICRVGDLIQRAYDLGLSGIAITEHEGISSHIQALNYYESMTKDRPFTLALGNEIYLMEEQEDLTNKENLNTYPYYHFILTALDTEGHKQLRELSTKAWIRAWKQGKMFRRATYYTDLEEIVGSNPGHVIGSTACFRKGAMVQTKQGLKPIEQIQTNDMVITEDGTWQKVLSPTQRFYQGEGQSIKLSKSTDSTFCTKEHLFLIYDRKKKQTTWKEAYKLKQGDTCFSPVFSPEYSYLSYFDFSQQLNEYRRSIPSTAWKAKNIPSIIRITPELIRTFGLWLADGHIRFNNSNKTIGFSFNETDFHKYYDFVSKGMEQFGIEPYIQHKKDNHKYEISYNSTELAFLWQLLFGISHAKDKHIPKILKNISPEMNKELFYGYVLGDGYFRLREVSPGNLSTEIVTASISKQLHEDIKEICQSFGFSPSVMISKEKTDKNGVHHQLAYYLTFSLKDIGLFLNKDKILSHNALIEIIDRYSFLSPSYFSYKGKKWLRQKVKENQTIQLNEIVYCLNVQTNHSFVCNGVIVHNCLGSRIDKLLLENKIDEVGLEIERLVDIFGKDNLYIECQPADSVDSEQSQVNKLLWRTAMYHGLKIIPTTDTHYLKKQDRPVHEAYLKSQEGEREVGDFYSTAYLMNENELRNYLLIDFNNEQIDQMFTWSNELGQRIKGYDIKHKPIIPQIPFDKLPNSFTINHWFKEYYSRYPNFEYYALGESCNDWENYFFYQIEQSLQSKIVDKGKDIEKYIARLDEEWKELKIISEQLNTSMASYYSTMSKIIDLIWEAGSLAMPARGSAAGFLTCYLLEVTQIDPVPLGDYMPSWRHLNHQRGVELPDIDNDSEASKKKAIVNKMKEYFGEDKVLNVATFSKISSKTAIESACKGLNIPSDVAGYLKSLIPVNRGKVAKLKDCIFGNKEKNIFPVYELVGEINKYPNLKETCLALEGLITNRGTHAAGVVVSNKTYTEYISAIRSADGTLETCYNLWDAEEAGLIKFDMLTVQAADKLHKTMDFLLENKKITWEGSLKATYYKWLHPDVLEYKKSDMWDILPSIYSIFQFDTPISVKALEATKPHSVMDLSAANSLLRLMPDDVDETPIEKYKRYKESHEAWVQDTINFGLNDDERACLWEYLSDAYGMADSQEKIMRLSMDKRVSGYSLKESNKLRKSIAKKDEKLQEEARQMFYEYGEKLGTRKIFLDYIWNVVFAASMG